MGVKTISREDEEKLSRTEKSDGLCHCPNALRVGDSVFCAYCGGRLDLDEDVVEQE